MLTHCKITTKDIWEIDELCQVMKAEVVAREISEGIEMNKVHSSVFITKQRPSHPTASTLVVQDMGGNNVICVYCKEGHYSAYCEKIQE